MNRRFRYPAVALLALQLGLPGCARHRVAAVPPAVAPFERQIRNAVDAGDGDYLLSRLREKVIAAPDNLSFRLELGAAYEKRGYPELAIDHYRLGLDHHPESPEAQLRLARALTAVHHAGEALDGYSKFLDTHPQSDPLYVAWLGILRDGAGDLKGAETAHRAAIALGRESDYLHNNLGFCLLRQGRKPEAAEQFRAALRLNPFSEVARNNLGTALVADPKEAILHFQSVDEPAAAHSNLAALLIEQGNYAEARKEVASALSYNGTHAAALANLKVLSELDGKPAMIAVSRPAGEGVSRLSRFKSAAGRFFIATPTVPQQTASRSPESTQ
ncbi:MAG: tetratricopeptide repeat protein [Acidobacteriota bacterium]|nr:tetratricopeptide repeat protein [Acidobacteriota bacterium]